MLVALVISKKPTVIFSIGIELEGTDDQAYEESQYLRLADVTRALMRSYPGIQRAE